MENINILITLVVSTITGLSGAWYGLRKNKLDIQSSSYDNLLQQITVYETIIESLREEIKKLVAKIDEQQKTIEELEEKIEHLYNRP